MAQAASAPSAAPSPAILPLATFDTAWTIIQRTHWDTAYNGVNWNALRDSLRPRAAAATTQEQLRAVLRQMVASLKQSHFSIIPSEVSDVATGGGGNAESSREGQVGLTTRWIDREVVVTKVEEGSAAERAGVQPGWRMRVVGDDSITSRVRSLPDDMDPRRVALAAYSLTENGLRGSIGSSVTAAFLDNRDQERVLTLERGALKGSMVKFGNLPPQLARLEWERREVDGKRIGVIRFNIWMPILVRAVRRGHRLAA